jgi:4-amino-4-deoxy-L-arabinose transferase-like glycosyltransferase
MTARTLHPLPWSLGLLLILTLTVLGTRSYFPIDETRYVSVAWEMWVRDEFLVPHLNGETYSHKPPLLFWLMHLGWWLFGVNEWSPRLITPLFSLGSLLLTVRIANRLWPAEEQAARLAPPALMASLVWVYFSTAVMFDMLVVFFTLMGLSGLLAVWRTGRLHGWLWFGAAIGLGILAKGPVILLHTLPPALLGPVWAGVRGPNRWLYWYAGLGLALGLGAALGLAWALPAAAAGGTDYANAILWGQTVDRVADSFAHQRPVWWYLVGLPLALAPLVLWPGLVRAIARSRHELQDPGIRLCLTWFLSVLSILSLISAKQVHYALPIVPPLILLMVRGLAPPAHPDRFLSLALVLLSLGTVLLLLPILPRLPDLAQTIGSLYPVSLPLLERLPELPPGLWWASDIPVAPGWLLVVAGALVALRRRYWPGPQRLIGMASGTALIAIAIQLVMLAAARPAFDLRPVSQYLRDLERQGIPLAHFGKYHGQYHFLGKLQQPFIVIRGREDVAAWLEDHPDAAAVHYLKPWSLELREDHAYAQPYRGGALVISLGAQTGS